MSPSRDNDRGTFIIDRRFSQPIGRLKIASGTEHVKTFRELNAMLTVLMTQGRADVVELIRDRKATPLYVLSLFRAGRLDKLPDADTLPPFKPLGLKWASERESPSHARACRATFEKLPEGKLADLPARLESVRMVWKASVWNAARNHVRGFLRDTLTTAHPTYIAVAAMKRRPKAKAVDRGRARSIEEVQAIAAELGGLYGEMFWTLCATSMRNIEYWDKPWLVEGEQVTIINAKKRGENKNSPRQVPLWRPVVRPICSEVTFKRRLSKVRKKLGMTVTVYDGRKTFARWCEEAGIILTNIKAYMGHGPQNVEQLYPRGILPGQLRADAKRLRDYTGERPVRLALA